MRLEQFEFFLKVANTHSMQIAADELHTSVQNVSKTISSLEKELNKKLFVRNYYGTFPTADGIELYPKAQAILDNIVSIREDSIMKSETASQRKQLRVLASRILEHDLQKVFASLNKTCNAIYGNLSLNDAAEINSFISKDISILFRYFDVVISAGFPGTYSAKNSSSSATYFLDKGSLGVQLNRNSPLAQYPVLSVKQLLHYRPGLLCTETGQTSLVQQALAQINVTIPPQFISNTVTTLQTFVSEDPLNFAFVFFRPQDLKLYNQSAERVIIPLSQHISVDYLMYLNPDFEESMLSDAFLLEMKRRFPLFQKL